MVKQAIQFISSAIIGFVLVVGCGAQDGADDGDKQIGSAEQSLKAPSSPTLGFGAANSTSHIACQGANASPTQACLVPFKRSYTYCIDPASGFTAKEMANISAAVAEVTLDQTALVSTTFTYTQVSPGSGCDVLFNVLPCAGTCTSSGTIDNCVCSNPTVGAFLTESLPGTYSTIEGNTIHLDRTDVNAQWVLGSTDADLVERHGFAHQLAILQGVGAKSTAQVNSLLISGQAVTPLTNHKVFSSGELCKMTTWGTSFPTTFSYSGTCAQD